MKIVCWVLSLILATAAGLKMAGGGGVASDTMFGALPAPVRTVVVAVELALAAWLVSEWRIRWAAFATILLLSAFLAVILIEMGKPAPKPCGCLGTLLAANTPAQTKTALQISLALDAALLAGALGAYFAARPERKSPDLP